MSTVFVVTAEHGEYSDRTTHVAGVFSTQEKAVQYIDEKEKIKVILYAMVNTLRERFSTIDIKVTSRPRTPRGKLVLGDKNSENVWNNYNRQFSQYTDTKNKYDLKRQEIAKEEFIKANIYTPELFEAFKNTGYSAYSFDFDYDWSEIEVDKI